LRVLVTFALENEFAPWRSLHRFQSGRLGLSEAYFAQVAGADVTVVLTGVGPARARRETANVFRGEFDSIDVCVSAGLAGALLPSYRVGQVLAASAVVSESLRPNASTQALPCSGALLSFAEDCGATKVPRFLSADHVVATAAEKEILSARADAVDMESFEVLTAAADSGIPAIAVRSVSDASDEDLPLDMSQVFNDQGAVSIPRVLGQVALRPQSIPGLMRLGKNSREASLSLALFLDLYVAAVTGRPGQAEDRRENQVDEAPTARPVS
jgi:adenosylhomocysteine nucleosidase